MFDHAIIYVPQELQNTKDGLLFGRWTVTHYEGSKSEVNYYIIIILSSVNGSHDLQHIGYLRTRSSVLPRSSQPVSLVFTNKHCLKLERLLIKKEEPSVVYVIFYNKCEVFDSEVLSYKYYFVGYSLLNVDSISYLSETVKTLQDPMLCLPIKRHILTIWSAILLLMSPLKAFLYYTQEKIAKVFNHGSSFVDQTLFRINQVEEFRNDFSKHGWSLTVVYLVGIVFFDVLLGILSCYFINCYYSVEDIHDQFLGHASSLAENVILLLDWLNGAPAGLKLNSELSQSLSSFFSYHVYLWKLYLELADSLLYCFAHVILWIGMLGISFQISIMKDLLGIATLHIYCFYVYAARIQMLQLSLLGSQWRAFRGHKWNPLKTREDSYEPHSHHSLTRVLTAVVFTMVVFLLPTTSVYYFVFYMLRICVIAMQELLSWSLYCFNSIPLGPLLLSLLGSNKTKGGVHIVISDESMSENYFKFELHLLQSSVYELFQCVSKNIVPLKPHLNFSLIIMSLLYADRLI